MYKNCLKIVILAGILLPGMGHARGYYENMGYQGGYVNQAYDPMGQLEGQKQYLKENKQSFKDEKKISKAIVKLIAKLLTKANGNFVTEKDLTEVMKDLSEEMTELDGSFKYLNELIGTNRQHGGVSVGILLDRLAQEVGNLQGIKQNIKNVKQNIKNVKQNIKNVEQNRY